MKAVTLALQGGGAHGAFTWGVLDRLLEDGRVDISAISGASAGAMNAALLAYGYTVDGRDGARQALANFWERIGIGMPAMFGAGYGSSHHPIGATAIQALMLLTRFFSPSQLNPFDLNPLREIVTAQIDFERLRHECKIDLFIAATQVSTGTPRLFRTGELTCDMLLASACIPTLHRPVEIDGEAYWDGGLSANPPLFALVLHSTAADLIMVLLNPCRRLQMPTTAEEIGHRVSEIAFGSAMHSELYGLALAKRAVGRSFFSFSRLARRLRHCNMHLIAAEQFMNQLHALSRFNTHSTFLQALHEEGRRRADAWLDENYGSIGSRSTFDLIRCVN